MFWLLECYPFSLTGRSKFFWYLPCSVASGNKFVATTYFSPAVHHVYCLLACVSLATFFCFSLALTHYPVQSSLWNYACYCTLAALTDSHGSSSDNLWYDILHHCQARNLLRHFCTAAPATKTRGPNRLVKNLFSEIVYSHTVGFCLPGFLHNIFLAFFNNLEGIVSRRFELLNSDGLIKKNQDSKCKAKFWAFEAVYITF